MSLYSLSVLRVSIAECDSVVRIVASEEKPRVKREVTEMPKHIVKDELCSVADNDLHCIKITSIWRYIRSLEHFGTCGCCCVM